MIYRLKIMFLIAIFALLFNVSFAQDTVIDYKEKLKKIDEEIAKYEKELDKITKQKNNLNSALRSVELSYKRTLSSLKKTKYQIELTKSSIEELNKKLERKKEELESIKKLTKEIISKLYINSQKSIVEVILGHNSISESLDDLEKLAKLQKQLQIKSNELKKIKTELEAIIKQKTKEHKNLINYKNTLAVKTQSLEAQKEYKEKLLKQTKNKESYYQKLLEQKRQARKELQEALAKYESRLKYKKTLDLQSLHNSFIWPLKKFRITQYFGNTPFARSGAYNGKGHNGVDMAVPIGTPVYSVADGVVYATGNTSINGCLSYGKWVLIKHKNGLASFYAHLSKILVTPGQSVLQGQTIALSGNTGYSTGPHLHFGVYDAKSVRIVRMGEIMKTKRCAYARIPTAPLKAYFNPLDFLPKKR